jgi:hypothetical protein
MQLLINDMMRYNKHGHYFARAAVFGPYVKEKRQIRWSAVALVVVYVAAVVVVAMDVFVWRA